MAQIELRRSRDVARLLPLLRDAEEGDARIIAALNDPVVEAWIAQSDGNDVAAAAVRWAGADSEIVYLATRETARGQGYGTAVMRGLVEEARARGVEALNVGTANSSLQNIAFY
jgi:N-acetylglutamate synthase-like GNAT family acetyltransferase